METGMTETGTPVSLVSLSGVLSALSCALDLTEGQPEGHAVRSCLIGMRIGEALRLDPETRSALYYALILKDAGCSSNAAQVAALFGSDDQAVKSRMKLADWSRGAGAALHGVRSAAIGRPLLARLRHLVRLAGAGTRGVRELVRIRCQRGAEIVRDLGLPPATAEAIRALDEHWDGRGHPAGLRGREIPLLARIVGLAQTTDVFLTSRGPDAALRMVRERRGTWFDPDLADVVLSWQDDRAWWDGLCTPEAMRLVVAAEPADYVRQVDEAGLDGVADVFADIIDAKTPFTYQHSARVAGYARDIADELGMDPAARRQFYRAGLLHDIGKLGVSNRILEKPGPLTPDEWKAVRQHPVHTWEILDQTDAFREFAWTAALHHERLDGSGYPWRLDGPRLDLAARILAVADAYEAMTSWRPYCAPLPPDTALFLLEREGGARLDADAVAALHRCLARRGDAGSGDDLDAEGDGTGPLSAPAPTGP
jgi:putative nucleotidyltransferase with HDIG domain